MEDVRTPIDKSPAAPESDLMGRAVNEGHLRSEGRADKLRDAERDPMDAVGNAADNAANPPLTR